MLGFSPLGSTPLGAAPADVVTSLATGVVTSITVAGQDVTISGTTTNTPTSGLATLTATGGGAVSQGPSALTLGTGTFTVTFTGVPAGSYSATETLDGTVGVTGPSAFTIDGVGGAPEFPDADVTVPALAGSITVSSIAQTTASMSWPAATDAVGVTGYETSTNGGGSYTDNGNVLSRNLTGLTASTTYQLRVRAYDAAGNRSTALSTTLNTLAVGAPPVGPYIPPIDPPRPRDPNERGGRSHARNRNREKRLGGQYVQLNPAPIRDRAAEMAQLQAAASQLQQIESLIAAELARNDAMQKAIEKKEAELKLRNAWRKKNA